MNYKTVEKDYTGCDPVIAEALKNNKQILCEVSYDFYGVNLNKVRLVTDYLKGNDHPYSAVGVDGLGVAHYKFAKPIQVQKRFKPAHEIVKWCVDNGWRPGYASLFQLPGTKQYLSIDVIKFYGGKIYNLKQLSNTFVHEEWLEDAE